MTSCNKSSTPSTPTEAAGPDTPACRVRRHHHAEGGDASINETALPQMMLPVASFGTSQAISPVPLGRTRSLDESLQAWKLPH